MTVSHGDKVLKGNWIFSILCCVFPGNICCVLLSISFIIFSSEVTFGEHLSAFLASLVSCFELINLLETVVAVHAGSWLYDVCCIKVCFVEVGCIEVGFVEVDCIKVGCTEVDCTEVGFTEVGCTEVGSMEVGCIPEQKLSVSV